MRCSRSASSAPTAGSPPEWQGPRRNPRPPPAGDPATAPPPPAPPPPAGGGAPRTMDPRLGFADRWPAENKDAAVASDEVNPIRRIRRLAAAELEAAPYDPVPEEAL